MRLLKKSDTAKKYVAQAFQAVVENTMDTVIQSQAGKPVPQK